MRQIWNRLTRATARPDPVPPPTPPPASPPPDRSRNDFVRTVRRALRNKGHEAAQALLDAELARSGESSDTHLAAGLIDHDRRHYRRALAHFRHDEERASHVTPVPYVDSLFRVEPTQGVARAEEWLADGSLTVRARTWHTVLRHLFPLGVPELRHTVHDRMVQTYAGDEDRWPEGTAEIAWLERWRGAGEHEDAPAPAGRVAFGVLDYVQPGKGKSSQNIGDHVQTLASMGHLARRTNLRFHSDDPDLADFVSELQGNVRPELHLDGDEPTDVELYRVDRDGSTFQRFPDETWLLEFGWFMHDLAGTGVWDFPPHRNLRPLFVSFHCNKRGLLTPKVLDYLREHGPIGCRDWTTVDLLLSLDVPAFFSGCLTTTVSTVFPPTDARPEPATVYVDAVREPVPDGATKVRQSYRKVKDRTYVENMREAYRLLDWYRTSFTRVVTKRLHCYLPTTSLGMEVDFRPAHNADVRFNGLFRLSAQEFEAIRTGMLERLRPALDAILAGRPADEVYAAWRETVAPEVAEARRRHEAEPAPPPLSVPAAELAGRLSVSQRATTTDQEADTTETGTDVVLLPDRSELDAVDDAVRSIEEAASGPVRVWVVEPDTAGALDDVLGPTTKGGGQRAGMLLPSVLLHLDRVVVVPVGETDVDATALGAVDLAGRPVGARPSAHWDTSGFGVLYRAARALDDRPEVAFELYRSMHARQVFDFEAFDTSVLVLDLDELRRRRFSDVVLADHRAFGLGLHQVLHLFVGPDVTTLP
ncbi:hypothetical protein GCM10009718_30890 [Isoptericola halotolerans]